MNEIWDKVISWYRSGSSYFSENRKWRLIGTGVVMVLAFVVLWSYMSKSHEKNYVFNQGDIVQHKGMAKEIEDFRKSHDNQEPLWTNAMFGGMPTYQVSTWYPKNLMQKLDNVMNLRGIAPHPIGSLFLLFVTMFILLMTLKVDPFSAAVGAFGFMMCTYYFSVLDAGHNSKVNAVAYLPLVFAGALMLYRGRFWLGSALTILGMGLELNANHFQITYYGFFVIGAIVISELSRAVAKMRKPIVDGSKPFRTFLVATVLMVVCMAFSFAPNVGRIMTTREYVKETMRGGPVHSRVDDPNKAPQSAEGGGLDKTYAYMWSYGIGETFTIINPFYYGDAAYAKLGKESATYDVLAERLGNPKGAEQLANQWPAYVGDQPMHGGPTYMGVITCFLFILGLMIVPQRYRWWILGGTIISILLSWGRNLQWFSDIFFDNLPLYNNFRAVSMWLTITSVCMAIMSGLALAAYFKNEKGKTTKQQIQTVGIAAGITLLILFILVTIHPGADLAQASDGDRIASFLQRVGIKNPDAGLVNALVDSTRADRSSLVSSQAFKGALLVLLAGAVLAGYAYVQKNFKSKENKPMAIAAVCLILFGLIYSDLVPVDKRYLSDDSFVKQSELMTPFTPSACDLEIKKDPDPDYRVLNLLGNTWNDALTSYHHKSIGGYSAVKMQRYQDLIDFRFDDERQRIITALNVRDSTQMQQINASLQAATALNMLNCKYLIIDPASRPLPNGSAMGHAWIVGGYEVVDGPDQAMSKLEGLDLRAKMIVEKSSSEQLNGFQASLDPTATITQTGWQSNEVKYRFASQGGKEQLVAFSEVYYNSGKGWQAYIDGQPVEHFRCNYVLRGMRVPAGNHEIVFKMEPKSYATGEKLALMFSILLFSAVAFGFFMDFYKGGRDDESGPAAADPVTGSSLDKKV